MAELAHAIPAVDMINATSRLQLEAAEVKNKETAKMEFWPANDANGQAARTIVNLITNVAKDQNVRYVLTLLDDMLQSPFMLCFSVLNIPLALNQS
ncbi:hypothetical protein COOONC_04195 [Cooperia oncophora]